MTLKNTIGDFCRLIKKCFGIYEAHYEYWIPLKDIIISPDFASHRIKTKKWRNKLTYYHKTGEFQSPILLKKDFNLVDGYSTYKIAKLYDLGKVPVYFVAGPNPRR